MLYPSLARAGADFDRLATALCATGHRVLTVDPLARDATVSPEVRYANFVDDTRRRSAAPLVGVG